MCTNLILCFTITVESKLAHQLKLKCSVCDWLDSCSVALPCLLACFLTAYEAGIGGVFSTYGVSQFSGKSRSQKQGRGMLPIIFSLVAILLIIIHQIYLEDCSKHITLLNMPHKQANCLTKSYLFSQLILMHASVQLIYLVNEMLSWLRAISIIHLGWPSLHQHYLQQYNSIMTDQTLESVGHLVKYYE